jgi:competence protein ComEC
MGFLLASAVAGLLLLPLLPALPLFWWAPVLIIPCLLCYWRWRRHGLLCLSCFLLCFFWSVRAGQEALDQRIPFSWEGVALTVEGRVDDLPEAVTRGVRFRFQPVKVTQDGHDTRIDYGRWQLFSSLPELPAPDALCTLTVKLKRPHGVANPGGFDYEAWLLSEKITATGSVKTMRCVPPPRISVDGLRLQLRQHFQKIFPEQASSGVLLALITGDRALVPEALWERYVATGIVHLMAISGMHITLLALIAAAITRRLLRFFPRVALYCPLHKPALAVGFLVAIFYSLLAGFSVPTERTLIMLGMVVLAHWSERRLPPFQILALALIAVLVWSPLAVHAVGFWLSFGAVAILLLLGDPARHMPGWRQAVQVQFAMSFLLLPLTLWFFERASWVSPFANLLAVPLVTFVIVPLGLLGLLCWLIFPGAVAASAAKFFWGVAITLIDVLNALLEQFQQWPQASVSASLSGWVSLLWLVVALLCLLQPLQPRLRGLAPIFLLPLFFPAALIAPDALRMTVLDVGQGLAVLVETSAHRLLYDTGPTLGESADAGQRFVLPALHQSGVYSLDRLMLSHDDSDHTGGASSILAAMPVQDGIGAHPAIVAVPAGMPWRPCRSGQRWDWDGWRFAVLYPNDDEAIESKTNNRSCVLRISRGERSVLLTGDLEAKGEWALLARTDAREGEKPLASSVLVLGHHGSRTSTSADFLSAVQPQWALISAGYRNQFHHPSPVVLERLQAAHIPWLNTSHSGAVTVQIDALGKMSLHEFRREAGHYWQ